MPQATFTLGAFGILLDEENRVLLAHRRDFDCWNLPGGQVESGKSPQLAVIREFLEETGLEVEIKRLLFVDSKPEKDDIVFTFLVRKIGGELVLNNEADQLEYFDKKDLPERLSPKQKTRIERFFADLENPRTKLSEMSGPSSRDLFG